MRGDAQQHERLAILSALVAALERRDELLDLMDRSPHREAAMSALAEAPWNLSASQSRYVLDLRLSQMTLRARQELEVELAELRRQLGL